jgi:hypothetical protein
VKTLSKVVKITLLFHFLCFLLLSFTDAALWNDGAQFLFRVIDRQRPWVDGTWLRYSELIYQIPTVLLLQTIGLSAFSNWVFKATLLLLPFCLLAPFALRRAGDEVGKHFIFLVIILVMPFGLLFPIGTYNLSLVAGSLILSLLFSHERNAEDVAVYISSHLLIFFGHELGMAIPLMVIFYSLFNHERSFYKKVSFKYLVWFELIFLIAMGLFRLPLLIRNHSYVTNLTLYGWDFQFTLYPFLFLLGVSSLGARGFFSKLVHSFFVIWFLFELYELGGHYFYSSVYLGRYYLFPFAGLIFILCWMLPGLRAGKYTALISVILLTAISSKAAYLWGQLELEENLTGCSEMKAPEHGWLPPEWSIPFYSLTKQTTYRPKMILVAPGIQCQRYGRYFLLGKDVIYHVIGFNGKIDSSLFMESVPQARVSLPYQDPEQKLRLYNFAELELTPVGMFPENPCVELRLKSFEGISEVEASVDGNLLQKHQFDGTEVVHLPLGESFQLLHLRFRTPVYVNLGEASLVSCPDRFQR